MNKEIIDILNELLKIPQSTNGTLNFYEIESSKFEAIITLVKKQLTDLQHQLEEKDKVIDEAKKYLIEWGKEPDSDMYYRMNEYKEYKELLEILERGKNVNSK